MHLKSISLKGFKSFPEKTVLEFAPGISVVVGPNGSGKSNVTDAVLWAMGEQSPLAIRGQQMQDVIFAGGHGVKARSSAEVELVFDNSDGSIDMPVGEVSILRRLDRNGEGEYRLNGARCRLIDVLEVLSDTGLGKEMHSVVSQGRVTEIVTSKPKDRRMLLEEAAGLGKHRKRRRRAQLKLDRTQENLDRALDVEREARSRLRPLKRQAEAAELHARLDRQINELSWEITRDQALAIARELDESEKVARQARDGRDVFQEQLAELAARREAAEKALAERSERREAIARRGEAARTSAAQVELRLERARDSASAITARLEARTERLAALRGQEAADGPDEAGGERIASLEAELKRLEEEKAGELERELAGLGIELEELRRREGELTARLNQAVVESGEAREGLDAARASAREATEAAEFAARESAKLAGELAALDEFLSRHGQAPSGSRTLAEGIETEPGAEAAVAAALGGRLGAAVVDSLGEGQELLSGLGESGGSAVVGGAVASGQGTPPAPGARPLESLVVSSGEMSDLARALLAGSWLVDDFAQVSPGFSGIVVTPQGRAWNASTRELYQPPEGGGAHVLAERRRRGELAGRAGEASAAAQRAEAARAEVAQRSEEARGRYEELEEGRLAAERELDQAREAARRTEWLMNERREAPEQGQAAVRRAQLEGELAAERRVAERAQADREERAEAIRQHVAAISRDNALLPAVSRVQEALTTTHQAMLHVAAGLAAELEADRESGGTEAGELRACAAAEADIQARLREGAEAVTEAEVRAQQSRDRHEEVAAELARLAGLLGLEATPSEKALTDEEREGIEQRLARVERRKEQLGPVNPLAKAEYEEALEHVETLERQRTDLEEAMRELRSLIRETDRQIRETFEETFEAAAKNFEELVEHCFPGGRGRLRLVREERAPKPVIGGDDPEARSEAAEAAADEEAERELGEPEDDLGVEIEVTPAGKAMKKLTLMSGGEKSMTAIAFLFAVFLARPCPFYILDEVEAALDDLNIGRFLELLRAYRERAQFIVVTHQQRTMEAADALYGVSMGGDGVSKVVSRRLPAEEEAQAA
jgi:chromosome segregation protein